MTTKNNFTLLWFDDNPKKTLSDKLAEGAARYQAKYGLIPNRCLVNPRHVPAEGTIVAGMTLIARHYIQPADFHISYQEQ